MPFLTTNYSTPLLAVLEEMPDLPIDGVEVGPWYTIEQVRAFRKRLPEIPFYFHPSNWTHLHQLRPASLNKLRAYLDLTDSPWASIHMSLLPPGYFRLAYNREIFLPTPFPKWAMHRFVRHIEYLKQQLDVPIILENMPAFGHDGGRYLFESSAQNLCYLLAATDCDFLLDLSHARVAADIHQIDIYDYLEQLPLERVVQLHLSGPRRRKGKLFDAHEPMMAEDYAILEWVLARTSPHTVTLEYFKDPAALREQILRLDQILSPVSMPTH